MKKIFHCVTNIEGLTGIILTERLTLERFVLERHVEKGKSTW
jgi:hypothetical protein